MVAAQELGALMLRAITQSVLAAARLMISSASFVQNVMFWAFGWLVLLSPSYSADVDLQSEWIRAALHVYSSPAGQGPGPAYKQSWQSVRGPTIDVVVRQPYTPKIKKYLVSCPNSEQADASEFVKEELAYAKRAGANNIAFSPCTYNFRSLSGDGLGHLYLAGLKDVVIDGAGSKFVFHLNKPGIYIDGCVRLQIKNVNLSYGFVSTSVGRVKDTQFGKGLELAEPYQAAADSVFELTELRDSQLSWIKGGQRLILNPKMQESLTRGVDGVFYSKHFNSLKSGARFFVSHYWYGGQAIYMGGSGRQPVNEDVSIVGSKIYSTPGVAIAVEELKRGVAIISNAITPSSDGISVGSAAWDGIHVSQSGGDVLIKDNEISGVGDDAINISNHVHEVVEIDFEKKDLTLARYVKSIRAGQHFYIFGKNGIPYAKGEFMRAQEVDGGKRVKVNLNRMPDRLRLGDAVRVVDFLSSRVAVIGNNIHDCACHGLLLQIPNAIVSNNAFTRTRQNPIRLLADVAKWYEGVGVLNATIVSNTIEDTGLDDERLRAWGAISLYAGVEGQAFINADVSIEGNKMRGVSQDCLHIANSQRVNISNNSCTKN